MGAIRIILVEDDWIISREIAYTLQDLAFEVIASFDNAEEALPQILSLKPDIVLLDIELVGEMSGIDLAARLRTVSDIPFIFLTALADTATIEKAKLAIPYAYLVKPVKRESLYSTIEITLHNARNKKPETGNSLPERLSPGDSIFVKHKKRLEKISLNDILWVEAYDVYAMVHAVSGQFLLSNSLKTVEEKFPPAQFLRVHRSYLVNIHAINAIEENDLIIGNTPIPVGKTYKEQLMTRLSIL